jgi:hypothetical protein
LKRQFAPPPIDAGDGIRVTPWLVPGFPFDAPPPPAEPVALASLRDVRGHDCLKFFSVQIQPNIDETPILLRNCETTSGLISQQRDLPELLAAAEAEMRERFGPAVNEPRPGAGDVAGAAARAPGAGPAAASGRPKPQTRPGVTAASGGDAPADAVR